MRTLHRAIVIAVSFTLGALVLVTILQTLDRADIPAITTGVATALACYIYFTPVNPPRRLFAPMVALFMMLATLLYFFSAFWRSTWTLSLAILWGAAYLLGFGIGRERRREDAP